VIAGIQNKNAVKNIAKKENLLVKPVLIFARNDLSLETKISIEM
jgi:hypothetical protein